MFLQKAHNPDKAAKIIARSFYKELRKAGFEAKHIVVVAAEILDNLNEALRQARAKSRETVKVD